MAKVLQLLLGGFDDVEVVSSPQTVSSARPLHLPDALGVGVGDAVVAVEALLQSQSVPELQRNARLPVQGPNDGLQELKAVGRSQK